MLRETIIPRVLRDILLEKGYDGTMVVEENFFCERQITISSAMQWLREKKRIFVEVKYKKSRNGKDMYIAKAFFMDKDEKTLFSSRDSYSTAVIDTIQCVVADWI